MECVLQARALSSDDATSLEASGCSEIKLDFGSSIKLPRLSTTNEPGLYTRSASDPKTQQIPNRQIQILKCLHSLASSSALHFCRMLGNFWLPPTGSRQSIHKWFHCFCYGRATIFVQRRKIPKQRLYRQSLASAEFQSKFALVDAIYMICSHCPPKWEAQVSSRKLPEGVHIWPHGNLNRPTFEHAKASPRFLSLNRLANRYRLIANPSNDSIKSLAAQVLVSISANPILGVRWRINMRVPKTVPNQCRYYWKKIHIMDRKTICLTHLLAQNNSKAFLEPTPVNNGRPVGFWHTTTSFAERHEFKLACNAQQNHFSSHWTIPYFVSVHIRFSIA